MVFGKVLQALVFGAASSLSVEGFTTTYIDGSNKRMSSQQSLQRQTTSLSSTGSDSSSRNGIRGIIFDIDGTLADSWNLGYQATLTVLTDHHNKNNEEQHTPETYPLTAEEYHYGCRFTTPERLARHVGLEPGHESFESVGEDLGARFDDYYVKLVDKTTAGFYEGIGAMLVKLHSGNDDNNDENSSSSGVQLGALTNACVEYAHAVLKANCPEFSSDAQSSPSVKDMAIYQRFSSIHGANSVPRPKPFGDGIRLCCEEMNLTPSDVVYIGDAPTDARAAVDAQCRAAIGVLWGSNDEDCLKNEEGFDVLCATVDELERAISKYL
ncbi:hypothetical protein ACHAWT_003743 [Skeletonema menzelii]|mmetsp:Transcript_19669/g.32251  ORF Transcript_19669/g.32251 Transcript_19669/m.32251 type:complete len:325 (-) Transcript_19669:54-1028(-)|eukprot:scaffold5812_cov139-Skeletonema_menzelii.AAC.3